VQCACGGYLSVKETTAANMLKYHLSNPYFLGCSRYNGGAGCRIKYVPEDLQAAVDKAS
jgi:hypothetical protein